MQYNKRLLLIEKIVGGGILSKESLFLGFIQDIEIQKDKFGESDLYIERGHIIFQREYKTGDVYYSYWHFAETFEAVYWMYEKETKEFIMKMLKKYLNISASVVLQKDFNEEYYFK